MAFLTAEQIIDPAVSEAIGSTSSLLTALQDTQLIERVEALNSEFIRSAHTRHPKGGWSWMRKASVFQTVASTTLNGDISAGDLTFILTSGTNWASSGRSVIEASSGSLDFVDHESKATHTLTVSTTTGDETISIDHSDGERVEKLYAVPSDYGKTIKLYVGTVEYFYERIDRYPPLGKFALYGSYFFMPRGIGARDVTLHYEKVPATITLTTSETNIPVEYQRWAIEKLKAHIFTIRKKRADIALALQLAEAELLAALDHDCQPVTSSESTVLLLPY